MGQGHSFGVMWINTVCKVVACASRCVNSDYSTFLLEKHSLMHIKIKAMIFVIKKSEKENLSLKVMKK